MRLKLASRKSDLARWQATQVARVLEKHSSSPSFEFHFKASLGDQNLDLPLASTGSKGVFTEDFYQDLTEGRCDLVVHSWKDLPVEEREETQIVMTLPRADVRDLLLVPEEVWQAARQRGVLQLLSSSPRRAYNLGGALRELLPGAMRIEFVNVRGNVATRLRKMREQNAGLILAKAGLDRLLEAEAEGAVETAVRPLLQDCRFMVLPVSLNPAAPAQGALAVEIQRDHQALAPLCRSLNDQATFSCAQEERQILKHYGGGCHQKIGVTILARDFGKVVALRGLTDRGEVLNQWRIDSAVPWQKAQSLADVFPLEARENSWFERLTNLVAEDLKSFQALYVARADALPEGYQPSDKQIIWTAGVLSWRRLARRGVWVHGTSDSLGESEDPALHQMVGAVEWCKLSHKGGYPGGMKMIPTYELKPLQQVPDLRGKTHFFWLSSSSFERARQLFPDEINNGFHATGPGSTFQHVRGQQGLRHPVKAFIGLEQFLSESVP